MVKPIPPETMRDALNYVAFEINAILGSGDVPAVYNDDGPRMRLFHQALAAIQNQLRDQAKEV